MTTSSTHLSAHIGLTLIVAAIAALTGCAPTQPGRPAIDKPTGVKAGTTLVSSRTIADFSTGLRCMDTLLLDYGTRDLEVIVEDFADPAQRVNAGTKEMLIAVVSDMTQRSRVIRIVGSGKDGDNTLDYLSQTPKRDPPAAESQLALRGSISEVAGASANTQPKRSDAESDSQSIFNIDLAMLTTRDLSVVPGVATRNSVVLFKNGKAEIRKFDVTFTLTTGTGEGVARAMRALLELSSIEVFGRLAKVPYWTCLDVTGAQEGVATEIQGWYDAMAAHPAEIIKYFQVQLRTRRLYDGPIDGAANPAFKEVVARYRAALGLSGEPELSLDFFKAYLGANHHQVEAKLGAAPAIAIALKPSDGTPLTLRIASVNGASRFAPGEVIQLRVRPNRDAHVYCFLQDENRRITRFFPNRFRPDSRVQSAEGLQLPGAMRFEISMNRVGVIETVSCMSTEHDVLQALPASIGKGDFVALPVATLEQLRRAFVNVAGGSFAQEDFQFRPKSERD